MHISDRMARPKSTTSLDTRILRRMRAGKRGAVYTPGQFLDFGTRAGVDQALSRLSRAGTIRRWGRGLYALPEISSFVGEVPPGLGSIRRALEWKLGSDLMPSGAECANQLGLSTQVPAKVVFRTEGRSRTLKIGGRDIELRHAGGRITRMAASTAMIASALESLGRGHVNSIALDSLRARLPLRQRMQVMKDLRLTPSWMHGYLRQLTS
jgi:hypothetical protein